VRSVDPSIDKLAALIRDNQPCVVLTGAGASTEIFLPECRTSGSHR